MIKLGLLLFNKDQRHTPNITGMMEAKTKHRTISIGTEKSACQDPTLFHDKTPNNPGIEGNLPSMTKATYEKPVSNIIVNGERLKACPRIPRSKTRHSLSALQFDTGFFDACSTPHSTRGGTKFMVKHIDFFLCVTSWFSKHDTIHPCASKVHRKTELSNKFIQCKPISKSM